MAKVAVVVALAAVVEAWDSGLEDEEGEGSWKPAEGAAPSTLGNTDRTRVGKVVGFFRRCLCALEYVCTNLVPSASIGFTRCQSP
jgi:hypothetical protein